MDKDTREKLTIEVVEAMLKSRDKKHTIELIQILMYGFDGLCDMSDQALIDFAFEWGVEPDRPTVQDEPDEDAAYEQRRQRLVDSAVA